MEPVCGRDKDSDPSKSFLHRHIAITLLMMIWHFISCYSRLPLVTLCTSLTDQQHVDDILLPFKSNHPEVDYQQNNVRRHTVLIFLKFLRCDQIFNQSKQSWDIALRVISVSQNIADLGQKLKSTCDLHK